MNNLNETLVKEAPEEELKKFENLVRNYRTQFVHKPEFYVQQTFAKNTPIHEMQLQLPPSMEQNYTTANAWINWLEWNTCRQTNLKLIKLAKFENNEKIIEQATEAERLGDTATMWKHIKKLSYKIGYAY
jgi:hypothetical protein